MCVCVCVCVIEIVCVCICVRDIGNDCVHVCLYMTERVCACVFDRRRMCIIGMEIAPHKKGEGAKKKNEELPSITSTFYSRIFHSTVLFS